MQVNEKRNVSAGSGALFILVAGVLWGTSGAALSFAPDGAQPTVVGMLRMMVAGVTLWLLSLVYEKNSNLCHLPKVTTACTGLAMAGLQYCFFNAVNLAGVAMGTTIFIGSYPVFAGILGFLIRKEKPNLKWACSTALAIVGVVLLMVGGLEVNANPLGIILALGAGCTYAIYAVLTKGLLEGRATVSVMAATSLWAAVLLSPVMIGNDLSWLGQARGLLVPLYLGVVTTVVPLLLFARGLRSVHVSVAATLNLAEPLTAALLGIFFLGEQLTSVVFFGMAFLLGGVFWLSFNPRMFRGKSQGRDEKTRGRVIPS